MNDKEKSKWSEDAKRIENRILAKKALKKQFNEHEIEFDIGYSHIIGERHSREGKELHTFRKRLCNICNKDLALEWKTLLDFDIMKTGLCEKCKEKGLLPDVSFEGDYISDKSKEKYR